MLFIISLLILFKPLNLHAALKNYFALAKITFCCLIILAYIYINIYINKNIIIYKAAIKIKKKL
jgi:hypothetical protein